MVIRQGVAAVAHDASGITDSSAVDGVVRVRVRNAAGVAGKGCTLLIPLRGALRIANPQRTLAGRSA